MTTAQTVQLLDANNNNISPAVCIDSIYYEGQPYGNDGTPNNTYRYALREKFIVGGNLDNPSIGDKPNIPGVSDTDKKNHIYIPYLFANKNAYNSVWTLSAGAFDISTDVRDYIDTVCSKEYASNSSVSSHFLDLDGHNVMKGEINMNNGLLISSTGMVDASENNSLMFGTDGIKLASSLDISISGASVCIDSSTIFIGSTEPDSSTRTGIYGKDIILQSQEDLSINAVRDISIISDIGYVTINASEGIILDVVDSSSGSIEFISKSIIVNNGENTATFIPPTSLDGSEHRILSVSDSGDGSKITMSWSELGEIGVLNYGQADASTVFRFVEAAEQNVLSGVCISFRGSEHKYVTIGPENVTDISIATIGGCTLDASINKDIKVMSINGTPVVGCEENKSTISVIDTSTFNNFKKDVVHFTEITTDTKGFLYIEPNGNDGYLIKSLEDTYLDPYNNFHAKSFVMSSDINLKTDVREDCFTKEMPSLHGFKWKDSSLQSYGFIAQELEEAGFEHLVTEHNGIKGVDYMAALSYKVAQLENENKLLWDAIHEFQEKLNK